MFLLRALKVNRVWSFSFLLISWSKCSSSRDPRPNLFTRKMSLPFVSSREDSTLGTVYNRLWRSVYTIYQRERAKDVCLTAVLVRTNAKLHRIEGQHQYLLEK